MILCVKIVTPLQELTCHMGSQCYPPPDRGDIPALTRRNARLSWPSWLLTYGDGIPAWIPVLTEPDVCSLHSCDERTPRHEPTALSLLKICENHMIFVCFQLLWKKIGMVDAKWLHPHHQVSLSYWAEMENSNRKHNRIHGEPSSLCLLTRRITRLLR